jgi:epsilon-lactone hydrolase
MISDASAGLRDDLRQAAVRGQVVDLLYEGAPPSHPDVTINVIEAAGRPAEWMQPGSGSDKAVFMYLHGGGYIAPYNPGYRRMLSHIAALGDVEVFAPTYRVAGEAPFPAAIEDAAAAYRWLLDRGVDSSRIVIGGDSAGAGLTVATLVTLAREGAPLPSGQVLISPWVDLEGTGDSMRSAADIDPFMTPAGNSGCAVAYAGGQSLRNPLISPIYADLHGLPPMLVIAGGHEILRDDAVRLASTAAAAEVDVTLRIAQGMWHIYPIHIGARDSEEVMDAVHLLTAFVRAHTAP